jgi:hypothetical protein
MSQFKMEKIKLIKEKEKIKDKQQEQTRKEIKIAKN